jgi:hypothetical protein
MPDASSEEYFELYNRMGRPRGSLKSDQPIRLGERSLLWLKHLNSFRPDDQKIQLTKPGQLKGIPIESPSSYSVQSIQSEHESIVAGLPVSLATVLLSNQPFPDQLPIEEDQYVIWAKRVDRNYQYANRWVLLEPYLEVLKMRRADDLRGFYFLSKKTTDVENVLSNYRSQPLDLQKNIRIWLIQMCFNNDGLSAPCEQTIDRGISANNLVGLYKKYLVGSEKIWNYYFSLENPRSDVIWSKKQPDEMIVPFRDPLNSIIKSFLSDNIEDEFKWLPWNLKLNFKPSAAVFVEFKPGVNPHVDTVGGNKIVMDANSPLTEWDVQWTIRHEFGHVLGFVDCYLEFYDSSTNSIINYQLDVTHLMCSRAGRMQESIYQTLKQFYLR